MITKVIGGFLMTVALLIVIPSFDDLIINIPLAGLLLPITSSFITNSIFAFILAYGITYIIGLFVFLIGFLLIKL